MRAIGFLLSLLLLVGCDGLRQSEEPLPTLSYLQAEYGNQPVGRGHVREEGDHDRNYETFATHLTSGESELVRLHISLRALDDTRGVSMYLDGVSSEDLQPGMEFDYLGFIDGHLFITSVEEERISGVFAGDISNSSGVLYPSWRRVEGGFTCIPDSMGTLGADDHTQDLRAEYVQ